MPSDARLKVILEARDMTAKAFKSFKGQVAAVTRSIFSLQGGLASVGLALTGMEIFDAGRNMAHLEKAFTAITGSSEGMRKEFEFVRDVSDQMGQNFYDLIPTYKSLLAASQGTNLEGAKTRDIFESIAKASATLGLTSDQTTGALRAIEQMMSKGKVQAEELRGQLGERLPGAFRLAAEAMGVSTAELNKMLDNGQVIAEDLLPRLAEVLDSKYSGSVDSATSASNKLKESWTDLKTSMAQSGFLDSISGAMSNVTETFKDPDFKASMAQFAETLGAIVKKMSEFTKYAGLRSQWNTMGQGADLAKQGLIDWEEFIRASAFERQKMVDAILKSPRFTGGYADNDAIDAALNNRPVPLSPADNITAPKWDDFDEEHFGIKALAEYYEKHTDHIQEQARELIQTLDDVDDALERAFDDIDAEQAAWRDVRVDIDLDDFFGDLDEAEAKLNNTYGNMKQLSQHTFNAMQDSFADFFISLKDGVDDIGDVFDSFFDSIYRAASQIAAQQLTTSIFKGLDIKLPERAGGGPVYPGTTYVVGERGPELLTMGGAGGYVTPNHAIGQPAPVNIQVINNSQEQATVTESRGPGGSREVMIAIGNDIAGGGPMARAIENRYGLMPQGRRV